MTALTEQQRAIISATAEVRRRQRRTVSALDVIAMDDDLQYLMHGVPEFPRQGRDFTDYSNRVIDWVLDVLDKFETANNITVSTQNHNERMMLMKFIVAMFRTPTLH
jgi:hypothetical protein